MDFILRPVGFIHHHSDLTCLYILPEYWDAMDGLKENMLIWILLWLHGSDSPEKRKIMKVHSHGEPGYPLRGVFDTRSPVRPNPIALYRRKIIRMEKGRIIVRKMDAYENTPIIDIKPYSPFLDQEE